MLQFNYLYLPELSVNISFIWTLLLTKTTRKIKVEYQVNLFQSRSLYLLVMGLTRHDIGVIKTMKQ